MRIVLPLSARTGVQPAGNEALAATISRVAKKQLASRMSRPGIGLSTRR
ncbi:hypothetical protein [Streptomyces sp. Isolate_219]|nr:hypothetical protein [Streptomyces sp. Isolate_219]MCR8572720.1 hypothetical protein [Streptomyces sp. Isolate_219]